jgi:hypothetical protein
MCSPVLSVLRLRVVADSDVGAVARVLERIQNLNVLPRRVSAEFGTDQLVHIEVDVFGVDDDMLSAIARKLTEATCTVRAQWYPL